MIEGGEIYHYEIEYYRKIVSIKRPGMSRDSHKMEREKKGRDCRGCRENTPQNSPFKIRFFISCLNHKFRAQ